MQYNSQTLSFRFPKYPDHFHTLKSFVSGKCDSTTFSKLTNLRFLNFSQTQIDYFACDTLSCLSQLEVVHFESSSVSYERNSAKPNRAPLQYFNDLTYQSSSISGLSSNAIYDLSSLKKLTIDSCDVTDTEPNVFNGLTSITELSISSSTLETFDFSSISNLNSLQYLELYNIQTNTEINYNSFSVLPNLETICFDTNVYSELNFESFTSLKNVQIVTNSDKSLTTSVQQTIEKLQSQNIQYSFVQRG